jgi:hypothetical protein
MPHAARLASARPLALHQRALLLVMLMTETLPIAEIEGIAAVRYLKDVIGVEPMLR